jgi:hypothetical protein
VARRLAPADRPARRVRHEGAVLDLGNKRIRRLGEAFADEISSDGRYSVGSGGQDALELSIMRLSDGHQVFSRKNVCCPDWNR